MRKRKIKRNSFSPWISYSDLYSALLLTFILLVVLFLLKDMKINKATKEELERIAGIKKSIIEQLMKEFKDNDINATIDEMTGSIIISSDILFDFNSYNLSDKGKELLKRIIPKYVEVILSPENIEYISYILIEGNTDPIGDYSYNYDLSTKRSLSVLNYLIKIKDILPNQDKLWDRIICGGRGSSNLIKENGKIDYAKSRRVEIKFTLKDEENIKKMLDLIKKY
ncbi:MAG: OmpA family protein [Exilispira sp.]|jgi:chemotaxis protein MotB|nr:OmpA family protein [Exilispira sp.]